MLIGEGATFPLQKMSARQRESLLTHWRLKVHRLFLLHFLDINGSIQLLC